MITAAILTRNPRPDFLRKTLDSLKNQDYPHHEWELFLVDNNSTPPLEGAWDLSWHPSGKIITESKAGKNYAIRTALKMAKGDLFVIIDDDLILSPDYLRLAEEIAKEHSRLAGFGGTISGEFEKSPPSWITDYIGFLAINDTWQPEVRMTNNYLAKETITPGAGLVVRTELARQFYEETSKSALRMSLGPNKNVLSRSEDTDMMFTFISKGYTVGYFPQMRLQHQIPISRLRCRYMARLRRVGTATRMIVNFIHELPNPTLDPKVHYRAILRKLIILPFHIRRWQKWWIELNEIWGRIDGIRLLKSLKEFKPK